MSRRTSNAIHEFLRAVFQLHSVDIRSNVYVVFGVLWGLGAWVLLALHHTVHGDVPFTAASFLGYIQRLGLDHFGVATSLLSGWVFGTMGTIRRDKERSRTRTIELLEDEVKSRTEGLRDMYLQTVLALSAAIEAKHPYTFGHCQRVWGYASSIAEKLGVPQEDMEVLRFTCYLHDIGKIRVPDRVLDKPGSLTDEEFALVKRHTVHGDTILRPIAGFRRVAALVRMHHEREDGTGYPDGLQGHQIPLLGKIVIVSDALDAMVSARPYRTPLTMQEALAELRRCSALPFDADLILGGRTHAVRQFDPDVVLALEATLESTVADLIADSQGTPASTADAGCSLWPVGELRSVPPPGAEAVALPSARKSAPPRNCWDVKGCGQGPGSLKVTAGPRCAVPLASRYDGVNGGFAGGRVCWAVSGALCHGDSENTLVEGNEKCRECPFMSLVRSEEGLSKFRLIPHRTGTVG